MKKFFRYCFLFLQLGIISSCEEYPEPKYPVDLDSDLIAHYQFNGNVMDNSGNGHNGKSYNIDYIDDRHNNNKQAISLRGNKYSFVEVPDHNNLKLTKNFTICFWVNVTQVPEYSIVIGKGQDIDNFYGFIMSCGSDLFLLTKSRNLKFRVYSEHEISLNNWHFIACVKDDDNNKQNLIIDNEHIINTTCRCDFVTTNKHPLIIGRHFVHKSGEGGYEYPFRGSFDDLRIYNRALNESELKALFEENQ